MGGLPRKIKAQSIGNEGLVGVSPCSVGGVLAVLSVPEKGVADMGKVGADLVGAPGEKLDLKERERALGREGAIAGLDREGALRRVFFKDPDRLFVLIAEKIGKEGCLAPFRGAVHGGEIKFRELAVLDLLVHHAER